MDEGVRLVDDVGVRAEDIDIYTSGLLRNVLQALSHLVLINAAYPLRPNRFEQLGGALPGPSGNERCT